MFGQVGGFFRGLYADARNIYLTEKLAKNKYKLEREKLRTQVQVEKEKTKNVLYIGVALLGGVLALKMLKVV